MNLRMQRLFARLHNVETGGEGASAGGEVATDTGATDTGASEASTTDTGPSSMLEAITQGLKQPDTTEEAQAASDRARDEQGRFAKREDKPEAAAEQPPAEQPQDKPVDELAMPEGLSHRAQERFQTLVNRVKEKEQALETVTRDVQQFRAVIQDTGASPEDFGAALDYLKLLNSGNLQQALSVLDAQRQQIALALGQPLPGADPLKSFPDLRQRVEAYQMDEQTAIELARNRAAQQRQEQMQAQQRESYRAQQAAEQTRAYAVQQIDQLGAQWAKTDPDYAAKEEIILKQLPQIAQNFPPAMWAQQVRILYDTVSAMPRPAPQRSAPAPLRSSGQTAGARQPSSMFEAIQNGLGYGNG